MVMKRRRFSFLYLSLSNSSADEIYIYMYIYAVLCIVAQSCLTLSDPMDCSPPGSSVHAGSSSKNTVVGCPALLQGILLARGSNLHLLRLLHWQT